MSLKPEDEVSYRLLPDMHRYTAVILTCDEQNLSLHLAAEAPSSVRLGQYVMIAEPDTEIEHYNEIMGWDGRTLDLRRMWTGKRGYFRVDDVFPVVHRKTDISTVTPESRIFSGTGIMPGELEAPDESVNPQVWKMLVDMNAKLTLIMERLNLEAAGLGHAQSIPVNISASGIRLTLEHPVEIGDVLELKMLLPVYPQVGILVHGAVVRREEREGGRVGVSLRFVDLVDEVRDVIIQYCLKRQREIIRRRREQAE